MEKSRARNYILLLQDYAGEIGETSETIELKRLLNKFENNVENINLEIFNNGMKEIVGFNFHTNKVIKNENTIENNDFFDKPLKIKRVGSEDPLDDLKSEISSRQKELIFGITH